MVLVSSKPIYYISILQTKLSDREGHEARRIGLEPMPLDQHIESGHRERQARLKIPPAPMHHLLQMALRHEVARLIVWHVYRPDLLFHQQYPTRMCGKVTPCTEPSDTVPTVTRLAPEPRGNGVSASIRRRRGWIDGMVNRCELSINVVTRGKPKMLPGLGQKGTGAGTGSCHYPVMDSQRSRRTESTYPMRVNLAERGKPVSLLLCR